MLARLGATAAIAAALLTTAAPAGAAAGWRTAAIGNDQDTSAAGMVDMTLATTLNGVRAWRLAATVNTANGAPMRTTIRVECRRGDSEASRQIQPRLKQGAHTYALPLPIPGGRCKATIGATAYEGGAATLRIEYR